MSIIHALCPLSAKGTPVPSLFCSKQLQQELLPSPPHSPSSKYRHPGNNLPSVITQSAREFCKSINPNSFMPPSVHMVLNAAANDLMSHSIVSIDAAKSQHSSIPYCMNVLDPLLQASSTARGSVADQQEQWLDYVGLNEKFADTIIEQYQSEQNIIWIHDYQLLMVPAIVRRKLPRAIIAVSIYAHFPLTEQVHNAAGGKQILQSLLAANVIGFLTNDDIKQFSTSCSSYSTCLPICTLLPAGSSLTTTPLSSFAHARTQSVRNMFNSKRIVFCQDTTVAGVYQTLAAFEYLLSTQPDLRDEIVFIHVCPLSVIPERLDSVPDIVRQINQIYRSQDSVPVHFYHQDLYCDEYDALLMAADVALIMGLHPAAAVAAQAFIARHKAVGTPLIVSEGSPLADQVKSVQQSDHVSVASAIHQALSMGKTQKPLYQKLSQQLDPARLSESFMKRLAGQVGKTRSLDTASLVETYKLSRRRLLLFDYDGTLTPIVANPEDARPTPRLLRYLQALCHDPLNTVWVVSGRDQKTLEAWLGGVEGLGLSAEHGSFMKLPGSGTWIDMLAEADMTWKNTALEIFEKYAQQTPGTAVEQKKSSITWHYRNAHDAEFALKQCEKCYNELRAISGADIMRGKMNLEVRSLLVNKGEVVKRIQSQVGPDFILCAGDDRTDEDMFRALQGQPAYCVLIGPQDKETMAGWCVETSEQFVACLGTMTTHKSSF